VTLEVFNLLGQKVKTLVHKYQPVSSYHIVWDGKNEQGMTASSGIYFYRLEINGVLQTKRMVLLK
jgi:flagellar hook assembly protein FlgD